METSERRSGKGPSADGAEGPRCDCEKGAGRAQLRPPAEGAVATRRRADADCARLDRRRARPREKQPETSRRRRKQGAGSGLSERVGQNLQRCLFRPRSEGAFRGILQEVDGARGTAGQAVVEGLRAGLGRWFRQPDFRRRPAPRAWYGGWRLQDDARLVSGAWKPPGGLLVCAEFD